MNVALPENNFYRALLLLATVALVICYAWFGAKVLTPRYELPANLIRAAAWSEDDRVLMLGEVEALYFRETSALRFDLEKLSAPVSYLFSDFDPITLIVNGSKIERLLVTSTHIEIGRSLLLVPGQLKKAVLKALVLQKLEDTGSAVSGSHFLLEVASDVLLFAVEGDFQLESHVNGQALRFPEPSHWLNAVSNYEKYCRSEWMSAELEALCRNESEVNKSASNDKSLLPSELSLRPLFGSIVTQVVFENARLSKLERARKWIHELSSISGDKVLNSVSASTSPSSYFEVAAFQNRMETLLEQILPEGFVARHDGGCKIIDRIGLNAYVDTCGEARSLAEPAIDLYLETDFEITSSTSFREIHAEKPRTKKILGLFPVTTTVFQNKLVLIGQPSGSIRVLPGGVEFSAPQVHSLLLTQKKNIRYHVMAGCEVPRVNRLIQNLELSKRSRVSLVVKVCDESEVAKLPLQELLEGGVPLFAIASAETQLVFYQPRVEALKIALTHGFAKEVESLEDLALSRAESRGGLFGTELTTWDTKLKAFKSESPLGVIPYFRSESAM